MSGVVPVTLVQKTYLVDLGCFCRGIVKSAASFTRQGKFVSCDT